MGGRGEGEGTTQTAGTQYLPSAALRSMMFALLFWRLCCISWGDAIAVGRRKCRGFRLLDLLVVNLGVGTLEVILFWRGAAWMICTLIAEVLWCEERTW